MLFHTSVPPLAYERDSINLGLRIPCHLALRTVITPGL